MIGFTFFQFCPVTCHNFIYYCSKFTYNYIDLNKGRFSCARFQINDG
ncbi:hypothetical protein Godav_023433 [Gossypium davidsonii]|uniref:Uncharacterized protein n=1 Tax=Gossypium davidsonii TaxID=34287 RepID=A0A7J8SS74_GOSDV|nr:hypothetical protein [Gossypium davidsonii]